MIVRKPFEQDLHDQYDAPAKEAVASYIEKNYPVTVWPNPDKYGVDLLVLKNDKVIGTVEVEVRQWAPKCPFDTIHVPHRKEKFFNDAAIFVAIAQDMKNAYWIHTKHIPKHPLLEVANCKVESGEKFYDVPTDIFNLIRL